MEDFKLNVKRGFSACKTDIETIKTENFKLKEEVLNLKSEIKGLKIAINLIKDMVISNQNQSQINVVPIGTKSEPSNKPQIKSKDPYEALLEFKAKSNKKDLLKQKIISMITENGINLSELKYLFVEHFKYTSKATFYNYLKEIELEREIEIKRENSKNIVFLYGIHKEI